MNEPKYQLVYVLMRHSLEDSVPCGVWYEKDHIVATTTAEAYNAKLKEEGNETYLFKLYVTALYD